MGIENQTTVDKAENNNLTPEVIRNLNKLKNLLAQAKSLLYAKDNEGKDKVAGTDEQKTRWKNEIDKIENQIREATTGTGDWAPTKDAAIGWRIPEEAFKKYVEKWEAFVTNIESNSKKNPDDHAKESYGQTIPVRVRDVLVDTARKNEVNTEESKTNLKNSISEYTDEEQKTYFMFWQAADKATDEQKAEIATWEGILYKNQDEDELGNTLINNPTQVKSIEAFTLAVRRELLNANDAKDTESINKSANEIKRITGKLKEFREAKLTYIKEQWGKQVIVVNPFEAAAPAAPAAPSPPTTEAPNSPPAPLNADPFGAAAPAAPAAPAAADPFGAAAPAAPAAPPPPTTETPNPPPAPSNADPFGAAAHAAPAAPAAPTTETPNSPPAPATSPATGALQGTEIKEDLKLRAEMNSLLENLAKKHKITLTFEKNLNDDHYRIIKDKWKNIEQAIANHETAIQAYPIIISRPGNGRTTEISNPAIKPNEFEDTLYIWPDDPNLDTSIQTALESMVTTEKERLQTLQKNIDEQTKFIKNKLGVTVVCTLTDRTNYDDVMTMLMSLSEKNVTPVQKNVLTNLTLQICDKKDNAGIPFYPDNATFTTFLYAGGDKFYETDMQLIIDKYLLTLPARKLLIEKILENLQPLQNGIKGGIHLEKDLDYEELQKIEQRLSHPLKW